PTHAPRPFPTRRSSDLADTSPSEHPERSEEPLPVRQWSRDHPVCNWIYGFPISSISPLATSPRMRMPVSIWSSWAKEYERRIWLDRKSTRLNSSHDQIS